jgi:hypothetical protein
MIRLKNLLQMSFAGRFVIRNADDNDQTIWEGSKFGNGYDDMRDKYGNYEVVGIRAANNRCLIITIEKESLL